MVLLYQKVDNDVQYISNIAILCLHVYHETNIHMRIDVLIVQLQKQ